MCLCVKTLKISQPYNDNSQLRIQQAPRGVMPNSIRNTDPLLINICHPGPV